MSEPRVNIKFGAFPQITPLAPTAPSKPSKPLPGLDPLQDSFLKVQQAEQFRSQGKLDRAQRICEGLLRDFPDYMVALHTLGLIYADKQNYSQALNCLVRAVMLNPRSVITLTALSGVYLELDAREMAAQTLEQARALQPRDPNVLVTLGEIYRKEREYELAKDVFRQALDIEPGFVAAAIGFGWSCMHLGHWPESIQIFEDQIARGTPTLEMLAALANAPASMVRTDLLAQLDQLERSRQTVGFDDFPAFVRVAALAKSGRYQEAWDQAVPANRAVFAKSANDLADTRERERVVLSMLQTNKIVAPPDKGSENRISLFILGPSRSGKTTMEALVSTLEGVKRGYENPSVENAVRRAFQTAGLLTNSLFEFLPPQLYSLARDIYLEELERRIGSAQVFTNTHPARIYDAGLLASVFPNVRFIFVKRDIEDTVLRMYLRRYTEGNFYSYDLAAAREHVRWYHQMMDVMAAKFPERARVIRYEDMVTDPAAALRVAADLCDLPMSDKPLPPIGDDRGASEPYRHLMGAA